MLMHDIGHQLADLLAHVGVVGRDTKTSPLHLYARMLLAVTPNQGSQNPHTQRNLHVGVSQDYPCYLELSLATPEALYP